jgi:hypothetical protein
MKQSDIKTYIDPDSFEVLGAAAIFPCSTQFMIYKTMVSHYHLTPQALEDYGIDANSLVGPNSPKALTQFTEEVSDDLYGVMARLAPYNYQYNCWLAAQSRSLQFPDHYACRKQFEKALIYQAQYKIKNFDVRDMNGIDLDGGQSIYHKQLRKELRHISPKALDILQALGLFFNGDVPGKRLINYAEGM